MRFSLSVWAVSFASLPLFLLIPELATAQKTIHVPGDAPTIQQAINAAQNGDTVLVAPGTYDENIDFEGKSIEVTSESSSGAGAANTIIAGSAGPTVTFQSNEPSTAVLSGFTITHQSVGGETPPGEGILISSASPTITANAVVENDGCGISITGPPSSPAIRGNEISWNFLGTTRTTVPYCSAAFGIDVDNAGSVEISNNTIQGNNTISPAAPAGAGIVAYETTKLTIANNAIFNNTNLQAGGDDGSGLGGGGGGGISAWGVENVAIVQNLVYSNMVIGGGSTAGIAVGPGNPGAEPASGTLTIVNNTVVGNISPTGVPDQIAIGAYAAQSTVENNIFESTDSGIAIYCDQGANIGFSYNDVIGSAPTHGCGGFNNISADPQFVGAAVDNFHLTDGSPVIAAGDPTAPGLPSTDYDGLPRIVNGTISLGVYEYQPVTANSPVLTSSANPSYVGQPVTFTATLNTSAAKSPVSGTMSFSDGASVLGTINVSTAGVAALSSNSLSTGAHSIYAVYSGDSDLPPGITNTVSQVVSTFPTTTTLTVSQNNIAFGQSVSLTAEVVSPSSGATVTGGVVFYDGTSSLGVVNVNNGTASYTTSSLGAGSHTIDAEFVQNQTYSTSTSNAVTVTVASDFAMSATPASQTIDPGHAARYSISVTSESGFNAPITLACSGLPAGASCSFSPSTLANGPGDSQLVIQTAASRTASNDSRPPMHRSMRLGAAVPLLSALLFIPLSCRRRGLRALFVLICFVATTGCGSPQLLTLSPPQAYSIVVTGASSAANGPVTHSTTITLKVQSSF
ncbi:MAG TPA: Ig-like domain repeat protein [Terracidiphilus sp.]|nr:Ig-like domain repeat protein [Terracidiphilus sp.]